MRRKIRIAIMICSCLVIFIAVSTRFVGIDANLKMAGGGLCISFDKWDMERANKIVVQVGDENYTLTDLELVRAIARESVAGTYSDYCCAHSPDGWMEIYRGDKLLRRMDFMSNHGGLAYDADASHWVLFGEQGHAFLSKETRDNLEKIIGYRG